MASRWSAQKEGTGHWCLLGPKFLWQRPGLWQWLSGYPPPFAWALAARFTPERIPLIWPRGSKPTRVRPCLGGRVQVVFRSFMAICSARDVILKVLTTTEKHGKGLIDLCYNVAFVSWIRSNIVSTRVCLKLGRPPSTCLSSFSLPQTSWN